MVVPADVAQAAREGNFAVVQAYFASGPQLDVEDDCENDAGVTVHIPLLHFALTLGLYQRLDEDGHYRVVELLLARGADPNRRREIGHVPLGTLISSCEVEGTPRLIKLLLESGADARVMGWQRIDLRTGTVANGTDNRSAGTASLVGLLFARGGPSRALDSGVARPLKNHLECLKLLLRAGSSLDNCRTGARHPAPRNAEWCIQDAETRFQRFTRLDADPDWIAMKAIVAGVRREGSWKAYCRVEHKCFLRLRSLLVRGRAKTTDARVDRILRLPNGACWNVLAYWREAA